jgi:hypothetical protein
MHDQSAPSFMAPPAPVASASPGDAASAGNAAPDAQAMLTFRGVLRDLRADAQDLRAALVEIRAKSELEDAETRAKEIASALESADGVFARHRQQINELLGRVREIFQQQPSIYDWCSDEVTRLENSWVRIGFTWPEGDQSEDQIVQNIDGATALLDKMIYLCGQLTMPARINQHLETLRIGQTLDFHKNFSDELEIDTDRTRLLGYLADHPFIVDGVVDEENGVIYRASRQFRRRLLSYVLLLAAVALGFGLVFVMTNMNTWLVIDDWKPAGRFQSLAAVYVFLLLGAVAHTLVDAVKQSRENSGSGLQAMTDWLLWLHVQESALLMSVLYLWIGLIGLAFSFDEVQWITGFFVGYSIDSFVDLFLQRFSRAVSTQTEAISGQLV